jgi:hypothetical protein
MRFYEICQKTGRKSVHFKKNRKRTGQSVPFCGIIGLCPVQGASSALTTAPETKNGGFSHGQKVLLPVF